MSAVRAHIASRKHTRRGLRTRSIPEKHGFAPGLSCRPMTLATRIPFSVPGLDPASIGWFPRAYAQHAQPTTPPKRARPLLRDPLLRHLRVQPPIHMPCVALEDLLPIRRAQPGRRFDVPLGIIEIMPGLRIDPAHRA